MCQCKGTVVITGPVTYPFSTCCSLRGWWSVCVVELHTYSLESSWWPYQKHSSPWSLSGLGFICLGALGPLPPRWFARLVVGFLTGPFWCCFVWVLLFSVSVIAPFFVLRVFRLACLLLLSSRRQQARRALTEPAGRALRWILIPL